MSERPKQAKTDRQRKTLAIISIAIFLGVTALVCWKIGPRMLQLASDPESFRQWLSQRRASGFLIYGAMVIFQVIFAVIPGEPLEIAGGYAFGTLWGTVVCLISATIGSLLVFSLVRRFGTPLVELFFPKESFRSIRFLQSSPTTDVFVFPDLYDPWDAEGPAELLCWADGHSLSCVFADVFCGSPSVSHYLNDRWGCARKQELCIRCRSFPCDLSY